MSAILATTIFVSTWLAPALVPYGFVETEPGGVWVPYGFVETERGGVSSDHSGDVTADHSTVVTRFGPYQPYYLTCQRTDQAISVPSSDGTSRQITVHRC